MTIQVPPRDYEGYKIRLMRDADAPAVVALYRAVYGDHFPIKEMYDHIANKNKESEDWATICSIACSPFCSPEILDYIAKGIAREKGYGYILRVIARNKNVFKKTLKDIGEDTRLEKRYKEVAIAGLKFGNSTANHQI